MNAYRFNLRIQNLINQVNDEGEIPSAEILEAIDACNEEVPNRVNDLYKLIRTANLSKTALKSEAIHLSNKAKRWDTIEEHAKAHLKLLLNTLLLDSYDTELCHVTVCKGMPVVEVEAGFNAENLEGSDWDFLLKRTIELDKSLVKIQQKTGHGLPPGVKVVAGEDYLRIT